MPRKSKPETNAADAIASELATLNPPKAKRERKVKAQPIASQPVSVPALLAFLGVLDACMAAPPADMVAILPAAPKRGAGLLTAHEKVSSAHRLAPLLASLLDSQHHADVSRWLSEADAAAKAGKADRDTLAVIAKVYGLAARLGMFRSLSEHPHHAAQYDAAGALMLPAGAREGIDCGGYVVALDKDGRDIRTDGTYDGKGARFDHLGERLTDRAAAGDLPRAIARALAPKVETTSEDTPAGTSEPTAE